MNKYKELIHEYIQVHKNDIVSELKELIKIQSVRGESEDGAPFGKNCAEVLEKVKKLYEKEGFGTELNHNGGYLLSYYGKGETSLGIFAHADVVPVSDDWILTKPFEPVEKDGYLIGRGSKDDKSGVIASLFCMKMIKELDIPLKSRLICFTGANEESGMNDIKNYLAEHKTPDFSLVPDTGFPLYRGNKGRITFTVKSTLKLSKGISISGGTGSSVIGDAEAVLPFNQVLFDEIFINCNDKVSVKKIGETIIVKAKGIAQHAAVPEGSINGISLLAEAMMKCNSFEENDIEIFESLYKVSSCYYGECFEIESQNEDFGKLTCVLTKITTENGIINANFNVRYGTSIDIENIKSNVSKNAVKSGWAIPEFGAYSVPHILPENNPFVEKLLKFYKDYTHWENATSHVNAGGTYRQYLKNAVEIGTTNIWENPDGMLPGHGQVHQPDECISIDGFLESIEIMVLMIVEIDRMLAEK